MDIHLANLIIFIIFNYDVTGIFDVFFSLKLHNVKLYFMYMHVQCTSLNSNSRKPNKLV